MLIWVRCAFLDYSMRLACAEFCLHGLQLGRVSTYSFRTLRSALRNISSYNAARSIGDIDCTAAPLCITTIASNFNCLSLFHSWALRPRSNMHNARGASAEIFSTALSLLHLQNLMLRLVDLLRHR